MKTVTFVICQYTNERSRFIKVISSFHRVRMLILYSRTFKNFFNKSRKLFVLM